LLTNRQGVASGAGPAGLAAAVYAASEGLSRPFGGQAGAPARIENYLGFPTGITGMALMARAYGQAQKFGVETAIPAEVKALQTISERDGRIVLKLSDTERASARSVVIASGARHRQLGCSDLDLFEASSVHYWASPIEAKLCDGQEVVVVGGGNSAGQAVAYLASKAARAWVLVRGEDLSSSMSSYLVDRITSLPNVEVVTRAHITGVEGADGMLEAVRWRRTGATEEVRRPICHLFLFIGADPNIDPRQMDRQHAAIAVGTRPRRFVGCAHFRIVSGSVRSRVLIRRAREDRRFISGQQQLQLIGVHLLRSTAKQCALVLRQDERKLLVFLQCSVALGDGDVALAKERDLFRRDLLDDRDRFDELLLEKQRIGRQIFEANYISTPRVRVAQRPRWKIRWCSDLEVPGSDHRDGPWRLAA
jgi:thioredoxin reductase